MLVSDHSKYHLEWKVLLLPNQLKLLKDISYWLPRFGIGLLEGKGLEDLDRK